MQCGSPKIGTHSESFLRLRAPPSPSSLRLPDLGPGGPSCLLVSRCEETRDGAVWQEEAGRKRADRGRDPSGEGAAPCLFSIFQTSLALVRVLPVAFSIVRETLCRSRHTFCLFDDCASSAQAASSELAEESEFLEKHSDRPPNALRVVVIRARDLPVMDRKVLGVGGSSDPLCTIHVEGNVQRRERFALPLVFEIGRDSVGWGRSNVLWKATDRVSLLSCPKSKSDWKR